jgi:hypothetical protein
MSHQSNGARNNLSPLNSSRSHFSISMENTRKSSSPVSEKEDKILDAETPVDDPNYGVIEKSKSDMRAYLHNLV